MTKQADIHLIDMPLRRTSYTVVALVGAILSGCVGGAGMQTPVYGSFCGPNHPHLNPKLSRIEAAQYLRSLKPYDSIDELCQLHDVCYAEQGHFSRYCDMKLISALKQVIATRDFGPITNDNATCGLVASFIGYAMFLKPTYGAADLRIGNSEEQVVNGTGGAGADILTIPARAVSAAWLAPFYGLNAGLVVHAQAQGRRCVMHGTFWSESLR
jgi:hypothetical protein